MYWKNDIYYNEQHSVTFISRKRNAKGELLTYSYTSSSDKIGTIQVERTETKNTWTNWKLIPDGRPVIDPPEEKKNFVEIPGAYGSLDLSGVLTFYPLYERRTGELSFFMPCGFKESHERYSEIMRWFNDNHSSVNDMRMFIDDEKQYFYEGHFKVSSFEHEDAWSKIAISYDVYPFKRELFSSLEPWKWDPFSFVDGIIRNYANLTVTSGTTVRIPGSNEYIVPKINVITQTSQSNPITVSYLGDSFTLQYGANIIPEILIPPTGKTNPAVLTFGGGGGTISIDYRGGWL